VFDVLRATSSMLTALFNGASCVIPASRIDEAVDMRRTMPDALLAGERNGVRISADVSGGVEFDLGNSPREFTRARVNGRRIIMTTTNGTRALGACATAKHVLAGAILNLDALREYIMHTHASELIIVCAGTLEQTALEDVMAAGALIDSVWERIGDAAKSDSVLIAREIFRRSNGDMLSVIESSRNGRRLTSDPHLRDDVLFCSRRDVIDFVGVLSREDGCIVRG
ncbi:MAG: 2-phosphosulfolactate phosphatase, partial [Verrucomicrobia bacterium]|nr:2-phosphosulfolactate phosphatase [Verrucomicrobiota bacterium]